LKHSEDLTILFADDEPWFHESLRYALEEKGYTCVTALDATEAIAVINRERVSLLVTDVMMPAGAAFPAIDSQEAGFHLIELVRKYWPDIPIVCLSVIGDQIKIRGLRQRRVQYLRKGEVPLSTAVQTIEKALTRKVSF
jgi:CheY-like chemotaxis protein